MKVPQGNSLCSYLKQAKNVIFFLLQNQRTERWDRSCLGEIGTSGSEEEVGKGPGRVNMVQALCTYACEWKNDIY
jgi:hypothetical protein